MEPPVTDHLNRWREAGLLEPGAVARILEYERHRAGPGDRRSHGILALVCGSLMVGAGISLFVAANWPYLGPWTRFLLALALVGSAHGAGAWAAGTPRATALHGLGTLALGPAIFLAGQTFNLQEHWPGGILLWALGAWLGYLLLRDWVQGLLAAWLTPAWLVGEWVAGAEPTPAHALDPVLAVGTFLLAVTCLAPGRPGPDRTLRRALVWSGGLALLPAAGLLLFAGRGAGWPWDGRILAGWGVALGAPLALAVGIRGRAAWLNLLAALWALGLVRLAGHGPLVHAWCALGAAGLVLWGLAESGRAQVNLGLAGFALTLAAFYFSTVMDKLGRSLGLMGLGLLVLGGGWQLDRLRRRLGARVGRGGER